MAYLCTNIYDCSLNRSRDMVGVHRNLNGSCDLITPISGTVCHPWASACYDQPIYQIWILYLHSPCRYDKRYKMSKMGWFEV